MHGAGASLHDRIDGLLQQAGAHNPTDRRYTVILADRARQRARELDHALRSQAASLPLFGMPVAIKDNIDVRGVPTSCGSPAPAQPALRDAAIVRQLEGLGAIVLAKSNLDEAALGASGRNDHFGRCINPRHRDRLSGGSSSGSAAAVAAREVLLGIGTDTLGSVRIPSALCGVVGFKPGFGVISTDGVAPLYPSFDTVGLIAGSLRDIESSCMALGIGATEAAAATTAGATTAGAPTAKPRILVLADALLENVDAEVVAHYRHCRDLLRGNDQVSVQEFPAFDFMTVARAAFWEVSRHFAARIGFQAGADVAPPAALGRALSRLLTRASTLPASKLDAGRRLLDAARPHFTECCAGADALLTPTCPTRAIVAADEVPKSLAAFVVPANLAGLPAVCWPQQAPGGTSSLQLIGPVGGDRRLIALARRVEGLFS